MTSTPREELTKAKTHQHAEDAHRDGEGGPFELLALLIAGAAKAQERCRRRDHQPRQRGGVDDQEQQLPGRPPQGRHTQWIALSWGERIQED
jgi:hypothetical protein